MIGGDKIHQGVTGIRKWLNWLWHSSEKIEEPKTPQIKANKPSASNHQITKEKSGPKILMIGWELPPHNSGGLGVACYDLCESLSEDYHSQIVFTLPYKADIQAPFMKIKYCDAINFGKISKKFNLNSSYAYPKRNVPQNMVVDFENDLVSQVGRYAQQIESAIQGEDFDIIHAHDWLSFKAGIAAKEMSGKPLIAHVHSTEFDRAGGDFIYERVSEIEREGMEKADKVVTVSQFTKDKIIKHYKINPDKIEVVHNGVSYKRSEVSPSDISALKKAGKKIVLFVGRMTIQKGPDYFLKAARKVASVMDDAVFVMVGAGDMERQIIDQAAGLGLSDKVFFTGFVTGEEKNSLYKSADLYVMPSVSEPFGIVALESLINRTPILISRQSGVSEAVRHALKVDFWDTDEMANKIVAVLKYRSLRTTLRNKGSEEVKNITWSAAAEKCVKIYSKVNN